MKVIKKIQVEGKTTEIHYELVSSQLVNNQNEAPNSESKEVIAELHKQLKAGAKIVIKPAKKYIQHF